jgi:hypothetical protein
MASSCNPLVDYLNSLRTQDGASNPNYVEENRSDYLERLRAEHPWFPSESQLRVETRITALVGAMAQECSQFPVDLVILTGDAGDGKTAACVDLARAHGIVRALQPIDAAGPWTIIKDASENSEAALLNALAASRAPGRSRLLVAINEGRLRRLRTVPALVDVWKEVIEPALASWIDADAANRLDEAMRRYRVAVVNFRHRMHVRTVAPALFDTWTSPAHWEEGPCGSCPARHECAILANARDLRDRATMSRVTDVVAMAHFSGQRLPFRRLQGMLAFALTGGLTCDLVRAGRPAQLADRYYSLLFQREARGEARPEPIARVLAPADPGINVDPEVDRRVVDLLRGGAASLLAFERSALTAGADIDNVRALRRHDSLAGEGPVSASWHKALSLLEAYATSGTEEPLRRAVVGGLNALHRVEASKLSTITGQQMEPAAFRDPARASLELALGNEFHAELTQGPVLPGLVAAWLESCPADIDLVAWPLHQPRPSAPARLRLDARLVALLLDVDAGYRFLPALGAYRRELARFHAHLLSLVQPEAVAVTLRSGSRSWTLNASGTRIRLDARD